MGQYMVGGQIQCPVVSLAQHGSPHLLPDPRDHITWTLLSLHCDTQQLLCVFKINLFGHIKRVTISFCIDIATPTNIAHCVFSK